MTSTTYPDHEHPQHVTTALVRDINSAFWRQALAFGGILLAMLGLLATAVFFMLANLWAQIGALQAAVQRLTP